MACLLLSLLLATALGACSEKAPDAPAASGVQTSGPAAPAAATAVPDKPVPTAAPAVAGTRKVALNVQGSSPLGLTVRVKQVEFTADATILQVSISYAGNATGYLNLAETETYLRDAAGTRILLKRPADNKYLRISSGETLEGEMVFLGSMPADTRQLEFVINDGQAPDDMSGPGLTMTLPVGQGG